MTHLSEEVHELISGIRYDMLCFEGISLMLNIFLGRKPSPQYRLVAPPDGELQSITVHEQVWRP